MARPRKPTRVLEISGAFEKDPQRRKDREGEPELPLGVGEAPKHFDAAQVECWDELAEYGAAWLTMADRPLLESAARLLAADRRDPLEAPEGKRYDKLLGDLGFGPIARTKIKVPSGKEKSKLAKFA